MRMVLQLNRSFEPIRVIKGRHALKLISKGKAVVVRHTNKQVYPNVFEPIVIRLIEYAKIPYRRPQPTRKNILTRDGFRCMYCGKRFESSRLTLDHIIPRSRGGSSLWENLVACCGPDNHRKGHQLLEECGMKLIHRPLPATIHTSRFILKQLGSEVNEWNDFLFHDSNGVQELVARG